YARILWISRRLMSRTQGRLTKTNLLRGGACFSLPVPFLEPFLRLTLERYFEFQALGADWRTEILAGFTTFMTMAYIVFVNPAILHETGMPLAAVTAATCLSAAVGSFLMGGLARYPIALAPGMGLNA